MRIRTKNVVLVLCGMLLFAGVNTSVADDGTAAIMEYASDWGYVNSKWLAGPGSGYLATSYFTDSSSGKHYILWSQSNAAVVFVYTSDWMYEGNQWMGAPATGYTATSYFRDSAGFSYVLWDGNNAACLAIFNADWTWNNGVWFGELVAGMTATSYFRDSAGLSYILWDGGTGTVNNAACVAIFNTDWTWNNGKWFGEVVTGYEATSYFRDSTDESYIVWGGDGAACVAKFNADGTWNSPGWLGAPAIGYKASGLERSNSGGLSMELDTLFEKTIVLKKAGNGKGTISVNTKVCDDVCLEMSIPYVDGEKIDVQVTPAADSYFAGWETVGGVQLESIYYANPGDTVFAIFEKR